VNLAILEAGTPPDELIGRFGGYPEMYRQMLGLVEPLPSYPVFEGAFPDGPNAHDAYIISGSPAGVYEDRPWIGDLLDFLRTARGQAKLVGICFGHQAMAQAFGGQVEKSDKGWGVGLHDYAVAARQPWMDQALSIAVPASHQDQVVTAPPGVVVTVASAFTPIAGLAWRDHPSISFQFHPEFSPAFAKALIERRRERIPGADQAIASLDGYDDNHRVAGWIARFLDVAIPAPAAGTSAART
jgi:GMP synthase-like glutamine amidotransferase